MRGFPQFGGGWVVYVESMEMLGKIKQLNNHQLKLVG
jgi:hypothetical protein